jgi:hypothetical protein
VANPCSDRAGDTTVRPRADATAEPRADGRAHWAADRTGPEPDGHADGTSAADRDGRPAADAASGNGHGANYRATHRDRRAEADAANAAS